MQTRNRAGHQQSRRRFADDRVCQRDFPFERRRVFEIHSKTLLRELNLSIRFSLNFHDWKPGLLRPASCDLADRFLRSFRKCVPQIRSCRVRILMRSDVTANPVAENLFAEKTLQHSQKRLALFVSNIIESAVRFRFGCDGLLNRMRGGSRVALHRGFFGDSDAPGRVARHTPSEPNLPLRVEMRRALGTHP